MGGYRRSYIDASEVILTGRGWSLLSYATLPMLVHTRTSFAAGVREENRYLVAPDRVTGVNSREQTTLYEPGSCECLSLL